MGEAISLKLGSRSDDVKVGLGIGAQQEPYWLKYAEIKSYIYVNL